MNDMKCFIWGIMSELVDHGSGLYIINSPRAGGLYLTSNTTAGQLVSKNDHFKMLLTTWLCEQRQAGNSTPKFDETILEFIASREKRSVSSRLISALLFINRETKQLGNYCRLGSDTKISTDRTLRCLAETESINEGEISALYNLLRSTGKVEIDLGSNYMDIRPTALGWSEIDILTRPAVDSAQAFVAMWFNSSVDKAYSKGIYPALQETGYRALRIDKKHHNNKIDDEIIAEIRRSRFVVADFTCEPEKARGGVYFEAGFAHGLGRPVIWTCRDDVMKYVHFDTRQYAHIVWKTPDDLFEQLKNRIGATIGDGPLPKPAKK